MGRLIMFFLRKFPLTAWIKDKSMYIKELIECDFCLGMWVYIALSFLFDLDMYKDVFVGMTIANIIMTGITLSFLVTVFSDGWRARFEIIKV